MLNTLISTSLYELIYVSYPVDIAHLPNGSFIITVSDRAEGYRIAAGSAAAGERRNVASHCCRYHHRSALSAN